MITYIKILLLVVMPVIVLCANAWGACTNSRAGAESIPEIKSFVSRLGGNDFNVGVQQLQGFWKGVGVATGKTVQIRLMGDAIQGQTGNSLFAPLKICTTAKSDILQITIVSRDKKVTVVNARTTGNRSMSFQKTDLPIWGPFKRAGEVRLAQGDTPAVAAAPASIDGAKLQ